MEGTKWIIEHGKQAQDLDASDSRLNYKSNEYRQQTQGVLRNLLHVQ